MMTELSPQDVMSVRIPAVRVTGAYKRYTAKAPVLQGLNMTVHEGTIYGLLGPSGCGKTTLLSCIAGGKVLDDGEIHINIKSRRELGYMPQELALLVEFTIAEIFDYFGKVQGLSQKNIEIRLKELTALFDLPEANKRISQCSGGQQRRVSMAVTLLHNPKLLILDEPTVGLDPVLNERIWVQLKKMAKEENKTIIITTHYIEEAANADVIGLMRGGVLLEEAPPQKLREQYSCSTLEDVFLKLSRKQEEELGSSTEVIRKNSYPPKNNQVKQFKSTKNISTNFDIYRMLAQLFKNYKWSLRSLPVTLFVCLVPAISLALACTIILQVPTNASIAYYIGESNESDPCVNYSFNDTAGCYDLQLMSCYFIQQLNNYTTFPVTSIEDGINEIKHGRAYALIGFSSNFTEAVVERLLEQHYTTDGSIDNSVIEVWSDESEEVIEVFFRDFTFKAMAKMMNKTATACDVPEPLTRIPMKYHDFVYGKDVPYASSNVPVFQNSVLFYTTFMYTSTSIAMDKSSGVLERSKISGLKTIEVIVAHLVIQTVIMTISNGLTMWVVYNLFSQTMYGSFFLIFLIMNLCEITGITYGFLVALMVTSETLIAYIGIATVLTLLMTCGSIWPVQGMHWILRPFAQLIPLNLGTDSYVGIALRGWGMSHPVVYNGFIALSTGIAVLIIGCIAISKLKIGNI